MGELAGSHSAQPYDQVPDCEVPAGLVQQENVVPDGSPLHRKVADGVPKPQIPRCILVVQTDHTLSELRSHLDDDSLLVYQLNDVFGSVEDLLRASGVSKSHPRLQEHVLGLAGDPLQLAHRGDKDPIAVSQPIVVMRSRFRWLRTSTTLGSSPAQG